MRMLRALDETVILGVPTTIAYHQLILNSEAFKKGDVDTGFILKHAEGPRVAVDWLLWLEMCVVG